jgi:5-methylcytosine-specific restriction enzyme subunit McrC
MPSPPRSAIKLTEHRDSESLALSVAEVEALHRLIPGSTSRPATEGFIFNPGGVVGVGQLGDRRVVIEPKLRIERLLFLTSYSLDPVRWQEAASVLSAHRDLLAAVGSMFAFLVRRATRRGVLRGYRDRSEPLMTVRGRIAFDEMVKVRFGVPIPIDCRYDDYSADIELNRMLLAATNRLLGISRLNAAAAKELRGVRDLFGDVEPVRYSRHAVPAPTYNRLTAHYRPAVEMARLVLRDWTVETGDPAVSGRGFFLDMARVFEDFVHTALREALGLSLHAFPRESDGHPLFLDESRRIRLKPDLSWWVGGRCVFVGDAKYKVTPPSAGVKHPDIYQLHAYAQATGLSEGLLIYASGSARDAVYEVVESQTQLRVRTLDLAQSPSDVLAQIRGLADIVRGGVDEPRLSSQAVGV